MGVGCCCCCACPTLSASSSLLSRSTAPRSVLACSFSVCTQPYHPATREYPQPLADQSRQGCAARVQEERRQTTGQSLALGYFLVAPPPHAKLQDKSRWPLSSGSPHAHPLECKQVLATYNDESNQSFTLSVRMARESSSTRKLPLSVGARLCRPLWLCAWRHGSTSRRICTGQRNDAYVRLRRPPSDLWVGMMKATSPSSSASPFSPTPPGHAPRSRVGRTSASSLNLSLSSSRRIFSRVALRSIREA